MIETRVCKQCGETHPITSYHLTGKGERRRPRCKYCINQRNKDPKYKARAAVRKSQRCHEWPSYNKQDSKQYYQKNKEEIAAKSKARHEQNPNKTWAHQAVRYEIKMGRMKRMPCEICGAEKTEAHHSDYNKRLDVLWLCRSHHAAWHRLFITEDSHV